MVRASLSRSTPTDHGTFASYDDIAYDLEPRTNCIPIPTPYLPSQRDANNAPESAVHASTKPASTAVQYDRIIVLLTADHARDLPSSTRAWLSASVARWIRQLDFQLQ